MFYFKKYLPDFIKKALKNVYAPFFVTRQTNQIRFASDKVPHLTFAGAFATGEPIHGGRVKLVHLRERFGDSCKLANLLYMVSSAQPLAAEQIVARLKSKGIKFVWNQNGVGFPSWAGQNFKKINEPMRKLRAQADFIVYQSEFCRVSAEKFLGSVSPPSAIVYNAVDLQQFVPAALSKKQSRLKLLVAGTHEQEERVRLALEALAYLLNWGTDADLTVAGHLCWSKTATSEVLSMIADAKLSGRVQLRGSFSQAEAPGIYRQAHVLLHLKHNDPCPTVPIEAMASGLPVVGSFSGGMPELISEDGGRLLRVSENYDYAHYPSSELIAKAVIQIWQDWPRRSEQARARAVKYFDKNAWLARHEEIFNKLLQ